MKVTVGHNDIAAGAGTGSEDKLLEDWLWAAWVTDIAAFLPVGHLLGEGKDNAIAGSTLCSVLNLDKRTLRKQIAKERRLFALPILYESGKGYFLPTNDAAGLAALKKHYAYMKSMAISTLSAMCYERELIDKVEGNHNTAVSEYEQLTLPE